MTYPIAVRTLTEFTAKTGSLDLRFTPSPTAQEGIAGHAVVTARRSPDYKKEVALSLEYKHLLVRGRADGYDPAANRIEEIKTYRGDLGRMPENHRALHWAQVKVYGWLLCKQMQLQEVTLALVYYDIGSQRETVLEERYGAEALQQFFEEQCERFLAWSEQELAHRAARDAMLTALRFPHADFRPGQRHLAESVYRAASAGRCLVAEAPTGIGKTVGALFPMLKACPGQQLDKVFFLTAKTSGRSLALEAVGKLRASETVFPLRVLEMVARDKACEHPDKACHGDSCQLAQGFYDKLPQARAAALNVVPLDRQALRAVALDHAVCPYYLSQELVRWSDVVVGDFNYFFDSTALLHGLSAINQWRTGVLVDEAHNLVERARAMYSASLVQESLAALRRTAPASVKGALDKLNRQWNGLHKEQDASYAVQESLPAAFIHALQQAISAMTEYMADNPAHADPAFLDFYFDALQFSRLADSFDAHSLFDITLRQHGRRRTSTLCLRNLIPAPFLRPRFAQPHSATLFSATMNPWNFYHDMLGLPDNTAYIEVESPFTPDQLQVHILDKVSTRYHDRARSLSDIVAVMGKQFRARPGNYLAFFSSFDYLQQVLAEFRSRHPDITAWEQTRRMEEAERDAFIGRFTAGGQGIGFAVLGGVFGEGIDLPGDRLIGAFIATLGLPQLNPVNERLRERMQASFGAGYDYAYLFPGMQKVVQAAGRVIRTPSDHGVVYLMDDRFARAEVRRLLPAWWQAGRGPDSN
ncbi:ATP-dependent DNA helicase [Noviherbaspirillum galbum]|uniref:ATP-dependent DNA helicase n=1 Tax=Noviherbaspirillum galbum TaxID=2709383 RepID=A0A6B3SPB9_9BURK|nr:ATP-dependent DNA helicase [Noviherbaspirillum galbum]NEX62593.1 ATP-dependent DNA helicase [Noviherbaspirillum galbum]